jgi:HAD superfamily hydrolase (TIGR01509 family)
MIQALIFDFDGLILDTETPIYQSWQELYRAHGCELPLEKWATVIGTYEEPFDPLAYLKELAGPLDEPTITAQRAQREAALIAGLPPRPGVEDYLLEAKRLGLKIGLASSSSCRWVTGHLERLGLMGYFDCLRARDDVKVTKPDPALYLAALDCLGVSAESALALEDSPNGVLAARRAGIFCVAVPNPLTRLLPLDHANLRVESLAETPLNELLRQVSQVD